MEPIKTAKNLNTTITLYPNRIEIVTKTGLMGNKSNVILLRNVTEVTKGIGQPLKVKTTDGKQTVIPITGDWDAWKKAIVEAL